MTLVYFVAYTCDHPKDGFAILSREIEVTERITRIEQLHAIVETIRNQDKRNIEAGIAIINYRLLRTEGRKK